MKKLLLLLIIPFLSFGQGWEQTFGNGEDDIKAYSVQQTSDGGYILIGDYILKIDENGEEEWSQLLEGSYGERSIEQTIDGGYIFPFTLGSYPDPPVSSLVKIDSNGQEEWSEDFGLTNNRLHLIEKTSDGGYIILGSDYGKNVNILIKTDENGQEQWIQFLGDGDYDYLNYALSQDVYQTNDGGYVILGYSGLIKTDENGQEQWREPLPNCGDCGFFTINQANDEGFILGGQGYEGGSGLGNSWLSIVKYTESLEEEWYFSGPWGECKEINQTFDGGFIATGFIWEPQGESNSSVYLLKFDANGQEEWSQTYGQDSYLITTNGGYSYYYTTSYDKGYSVKQTSDGGYIICGETSILEEDNDVIQYVYIIKTDSEGNITSTNIIETPTINKNLITTIDILGRETTNKGFQLHIYDDGSVEKKYLIK